MTRRSIRKLNKGHLDFMVADEKDRLIKKRRREERRAKKEQKARVEAILCEAFDKGFSVGEQTNNAAPRVGAPVSASTSTDVEMKSTGISKRGKLRKNKKQLRRLEKIRQRQASRTAMQV